MLGEEAFLPQTGCYRLTDETVAQIINGDNVIAAYGGNAEGTAFWILVYMWKIRLMLM